MEGSFESKPRMCFEIEKVIGISSDGNYQVQWAPAWVTRFHLVGCEHLIQEFLQQQAVKELPNEPETAELESTHESYDNVTNDNVLHGEVNPGLVYVAIDQQEREGKAIPPEQDSKANLDAILGIQEHSRKAVLTGDNAVGENIHHPVSDVNANTTYVNVKIEDDETEPSTSSEVMVFDNSPDHWVMNQDGVGTISNETLSPALYMYHGAEGNPPGDNVTTSKESWYVNATHCCSTCGGFFQTKEQLSYHMKSHKVHSCPHCDRTFRNVSGLNNHILTHVDANSYACDICGKTFAANSSLKIHYRWSHSGNEPYKCNTCDESFRALGDRNRHSILCTGVQKVQNNNAE